MFDRAFDQTSGQNVVCGALRLVYGRFGPWSFLWCAPRCSSTVNVRTQEAIEDAPRRFLSFCLVLPPPFPLILLLFLFHSLVSPSLSLPRSPSSLPPPSLPPPSLPPSPRPLPLSHTHSRSRSRVALALSLPSPSLARTLALAPSAEQVRVAMPALYSGLSAELAIYSNQNITGQTRIYGQAGPGRHAGRLPGPRARDPGHRRRPRRRPGRPHRPRTGPRTPLKRAKMRKRQKNEARAESRFSPLLCMTWVRPPTPPRALTSGFDSPSPAANPA